MPEFSKAHAKLLAACVNSFRDAFANNLVEVLKTQFRGCTPQEVTEVLAELALLERQLQVRTRRARVHDAHSRMLKRVLIEERRRAAEAIEEPVRKAVDGRLIRELQRATGKLDQFMQQPWFLEATALRLPRLTDYLSVHYAEEAMGEQLKQLPRERDEKFNILEAPALFLPDLGYYRVRCGLREAPIAIAYIDIDDFKSFNTKYTETKVDLALLVPMMEQMEAHVFAQGHAYRYGGDEYVMLLPNCDQERAIASLQRLQERVAQYDYKGIAGGPGLSIGLVVIANDCILTDREILAKANEAKNYAKTKKGSIAHFDGALHLSSKLRLVRKPRRRKRA